MMSYPYEGKIILCRNGELPPALPAFPIAAEKCCCFTGHRPDQLPQGEGLDRLKERLMLFIRVYAEQGVDTFVSGMARGFDLIAAQCVLEHPALENVRLICALPYLGQFREMRTPQEKELYRRALEKCSAAYCMSENFHKQCYKVRNEFMVKCSAHVIGYMKDGETRSGTAQTLRMAENYGRDIVLIRERDISNAANDQITQMTI